MYKLGLLLILSFGLTACGGFSAEDGAGSAAGLSLARKPYGTCDRKDVPTINLCMEAVGPDYNEPGYLDILKSSCESSGGTFSTANCNQTESFGTCVVGAGQSNLTFVSYYAPEYDAISAKAACAESGGSFVNP